LKLCEFPQDQKLELKYRASRDEFKTTDFHSKCDETDNTITVIQAKKGNVFVGFTEEKWHSRGEWITDHILAESLYFETLEIEVFVKKS
jgi:hypothetical protein